MGPVRVVRFSDGKVGPYCWRSDHRLTTARSPWSALTRLVIAGCAGSWVGHYNHDRPHQGIGMVPPYERFRLATAEPSTIELEAAAPDTTEQLPIARRRVASNGRISFASTYYLAGVWLAGETIEVICDGGVVHLHHRGVLIASHARRHKPAKEAAAVRRGQKRRPQRAATPRPSASSASTHAVPVVGPDAVGLVNGSARRRLVRSSGSKVPVRSRREAQLALVLTGMA